MNELTGKRALVTGASRGIGAAIALALAEKGADVAITYERSADRAAEVVRAIEGKGRKALAIQADSADPAAVKRSVDEAAQALGGLDILVNNVGIARLGAIVDLSLADIDALLNVNVRSAVLATQAAIPHSGKAAASSPSARTPPNAIVFRACRIFTDQVRAARLDARPCSRTRAAGHHRKPGSARTDKHRDESGQWRIR